MSSSFRLSLRCCCSITNSRSTSLIKPWHTRSASSFVPGTSTLDSLIPPLHKPPSTNWFTTNPELADSVDKLDLLIHQSRQHLHRVGILKRYSASPDFTGTAIRLKWLKWKMALEDQLQIHQDHSNSSHLTNLLWNKNVKWHQLPTLSLLLQPNQARQLKMIEYNHIISKLNELKSLNKYLTMLKTLNLDYDTKIIEIHSSIEQVLIKFSQNESSLNQSKNNQVERDHLGRFYGLGRKKESTARAWIIEPRLTEPTTTTTTSETKPTEATSNSKISNPSSLLPSETESSGDNELPSNLNLDLPLGQIKINGRSIVDYFHSPRQRAMAIRPLEITNCVGHYNVHVLTHGGGKMGQAAAIAHAIANALSKALQEASKNVDGTAQERYAKKVLMKSSLTLRDPRVVERKKTGKPGAKSSYRWVKR